MQVTLNQDEIHQAVERFVRDQITIKDGQTVEIDFTAGRGPNGISATLNITAATAGEAGPTLRAVRKATGIEQQMSTPLTTNEPEGESAPAETAEEEAEAVLGTADTPETEDDAPEAADEASEPEAAEDAQEETPAPRGPSIFSKKSA